MVEQHEAIPNDQFVLGLGLGLRKENEIKEMKYTHKETIRH